MLTICMVLLCEDSQMEEVKTVYIEDCGGWWLSGCRGSVAEHWQLKPEVSWVQLPVAAGLFTFLYFCLNSFNSSAIGIKVLF